LAVGSWQLAVGSYAISIAHRHCSQYFTKDFHCEKLSSGVYHVIFETEKEKMGEEVCD
jgi:hypothetical protein